MSGTLGLRAPSSGGPFENLMAGVFLACGFVVDVDLLWTIPGEGDIAQFDFVASARAGTSVRRIIAECKGGDRWGYSDAFQLLGQTVLTGQEQAVLLVAQRRSAEREARSARTISRQFAGTGLHVIAVPVDDRLPGAPVADIGAVEHALFTQGLVPIPAIRLEAADIEACTRGIARLRGAIERIGRTLANPMSPPAPRQPVSSIRSGTGRSLRETPHSGLLFSALAWRPRTAHRQNGIPRPQQLTGTSPGTFPSSRHMPQHKR